MTEARISIFLTGATGYIGGSVLIRLLQHPRASRFDITVIVRSPDKAKKLESFGVKPVVGSLEDSPLIEELASKAHVVFDTHDVDNRLEAIRAILRGLRKRHDTVGDLPILIHTSGTGVLGDDARGLHPTDIIFDDLNADQLNTLPDSPFHRNVDLEVVGADKAGYLKSYIILPSNIYGLAKTPLVDAGIQNKHSIQIPALIKASLSRNQAGVVGKGASIWPNVHINDAADLYIVLFNAITANADTVAHGAEGYYFGENGEYTWYELSRSIGEAFVELGISKDPEPTPFNEKELAKYFRSLEIGYHVFGTNSRCRGNRSRSIGWKPKYTTKDMFASVKPEVEAILMQ